MLFGRERTDLRFRIQRIADFQRAHFVDKLLDVVLINFLGDNETLRRDAGLPGIDRARFHADFRRHFQIRARHDDERIAAAEFEHAFLDLPRGGAGDFAAGALASRQRDRFHARVFDHCARLLGFDEQGLKHAFRETGAPKNIFNRERALRNIGGVFEQADIARHQGRRGEAEHLPERKIPWHDGENGPSG